MQLLTHSFGFTFVSPDHTLTLRLPDLQNHHTFILFRSTAMADIFLILHKHCSCLSHIMYCDNFSFLAQLLVSLELMSSFLFCLILNTNSTPNSAKSSNLPRGIPVYQVFYHLEVDSAFSAGAQPAVWDHHTSTLKSPSSFAPRQDPLLPASYDFLFLAFLPLFGGTHQVASWERVQGCKFFETLSFWKYLSSTLTLNGLAVYSILA